MMARASTLVLAGLALLCAVQQAAALSEGLVNYLDQECAAKLTTIYGTYYPAPGGTACRNLINATLTETDPAKCPDRNATIACFNQERTQWLGFVAMCEVFHWSDFNLGPVVPPGEGQVSGDKRRRRQLLQNNFEGGSSTPTVSTSPVILAEQANNGSFFASVAYTTSGPDVVNGCFPTMADPRDFYLYLLGQLDSATTSAAGRRFVTESAVLLGAAAVAAAVLLAM